jgi:hypothetical protein
MFVEVYSHDPRPNKNFLYIFRSRIFKHMYSALDKYIYFQSNDPPLDRGEVSDTIDLQITEIWFLGCSVH